MKGPRFVDNPKPYRDEIEFRPRIGRAKGDRWSLPKSRISRPRSGVRASLSDRAQKVAVSGGYHSAGGKVNGEGLRAHLKYIARDSAKGHTAEAKLFANGEKTSTEEALTAIRDWTADPYHFRIAVSPEFGERVDLERMGKDIIERLESEVGSKFEWFSAEHHDTGKPHLHLLIRGVRLDGKPLILPRDKYFAGGRLRAIASEVVTRQIGPRTEKEIREFRKREIMAPRVTPLDRFIADVITRTRSGRLSTWRVVGRRRRSERQHWLRVRSRLRYLSSIGLSSEKFPGVFQVKLGFEEELRRMSKRNDLRARFYSRERVSFDRFVSITNDRSGPELIFGRVKKTGVENEAYGTRYALIEGHDGALYHLSLDSYSHLRGLKLTTGQLVEVQREFNPSPIKSIDEKIFDYAKANSWKFTLGGFAAYAKERRLNGRVSLDRYMGNYIKRLEALEAWGIVKPEGGEIWKVPESLKDEIIAHSKRFPERVEANIRAYGSWDLMQLAGEKGLTFLDLVQSKSGAEDTKIKTEFQLQLLESIQRRKEFLRATGFSASPEAKLSSGELGELYRRSIERVEGRSKKIIGNARTLRSKECFQGTYRGVVLLTSGLHAAVSNGNETVLIPFARGMQRLNVGADIEVEGTAPKTEKFTFEQSVGVSFSFRALARRQGMERKQNL